MEIFFSSCLFIPVNDNVEGRLQGVLFDHVCENFLHDRENPITLISYDWNGKTTVINLVSIKNSK